MIKAQLLAAAIYYSPALLIYWIFRRVLTNQYLYNLLILGGTIAHELCHFITGLLLNARPVRFSIIPKKTGEAHWTLGSVSFANITFYNGIFVGMAPLLLLVPFYLVVPTYFVMGDLQYCSLRDITAWFALAYLGPSAIPSKQDYKIAFMSFLPVLVCVVFGLVFWLSK